MKVIRYQVMGKTVAAMMGEGGLTEMVEQDFLYDVVRPYSAQNEELAKQEAQNGKYIVEDDGNAQTNVPTQLDRVEAQAIYTAMMTNTLLEE